MPELRVNSNMKSHFVQECRIDTYLWKYLFTRNKREYKIIRLEMIPPIFIFKKEPLTDRRTQHIDGKFPKCLRKQSDMTEERLNKLIYNMLAQEIVGVLKASKSNKYEKAKVILDRYGISDEELSLDNMIKNLYKKEHTPQ